jgi:cytochrome c-type biogenesis protein CcmH
VRILFLCLLFCSFIAQAASEDLHHFAAAQDAKRFYDLTHSLRCVVCQSQAIADSDAPLAKDLREKIALLINAKKSDEQIKNYLVSRYGEFILLEPRFNKLTIFLWLFPIAGGAFILFLIRGRFFTQ